MRDSISIMVWIVEGFVISDLMSKDTQKHMGVCGASPLQSFLFKTPKQLGVIP
jgi:hypothetical protein